ncbi:MAG TPA: hypothetical protein VG095_06330 [Chthoniobacterales bacterium]|nr:hypothetical protein [Chthoniobacterales bacterium]
MRSRSSASRRLNQPSTESEKRLSFGGALFGHAVLFIFCVGLPALFTAAAPLTVTHFVREDGAINATISKRVLFLVPYRTIRIANVQAIDDHFISGGRSPTRSGSPTSTGTQLEDSAYLTIEGENNSGQVEVSPVNIEKVRAQARAFLEDSSRQRLRLVTVANWKFGVFAGGLLSLLTVFYIYLQLSSFVRWIRGSG